jgi:putative phosphoribosyl transferase
MGNLAVVTETESIFQNREEAGELLAEQLRRLDLKDCLVVGIPRGGVVVAFEIAKNLGVDLDVILTKKIGVPGDPELAAGAVSENGQMFLNRDIVSSFSIDEAYIEREKNAQFIDIKRHAEMYRRYLPKKLMKNKAVILTDDGIATGATMRLAIRQARSEGAAQVIVALPVGPKDILEILAGEADEVICLESPDYFSAVGQFYAEFDPVEEKDILATLKKHYSPRR